MDVTRKAWTAFAIALEGGVHKSLLPAAGAAVKSAYDVCVYDPTFSNVRVWDSEGRVNMRFAHGALESLERAHAKNATKQRKDITVTNKQQHTT